MSYQTGVPASTQNLIDTFIAWLVAEGGFTLANAWTFQSGSNVDASGSTNNWNARALLRDGQYLTLAWATTSPNIVYSNSCTNNPTTGRINAQTDCDNASMAVVFGAAPLRYHMFSDGNSSHCVVEWLGGVFVHMNVGVIEKYGAFTGGLYTSGTLWSSDSNSGNYYAWDNSGYHRRPFDAYDGSFAGRGGHVRVTYSTWKPAQFGWENGTGGLGVGVPLGIRSTIDRSPNAYNGRATLAPIEIVMGQTDSSNPAAWIPLGRVSNAAYINITNLNPGDTILTDWMVFPLSAKNSGGTVASGYINSGNYGMAYRK